LHGERVTHESFGNGTDQHRLNLFRLQASNARLSVLRRSSLLDISRYLMEVMSRSLGTDFTYCLNNGGAVALRRKGVLQIGGANPVDVIFVPGGIHGGELLAIHYSSSHPASQAWSTCSSRIARSASAL
jgi:hypothetical protein